MNRKLILAVLSLPVWIGMITIANAQTTPWTDIKEKNRLAIVYLDTKYRWENGKEEYIHGSGFLVDSVGHILTCEHVVSDERINGREIADKARLTSITASIGGPEELKREVSVIYHDRNKDLAILMLKSEPPAPLRKVRIDLVSKLDSVGELYALGFPEHGGSLDGVSGHVRSRLRPGEDWTMTNPINPGQSGGPVFSQEGRVVGISKGVVPDSNQMNVVIPIRRAIDWLEEIGAMPDGDGEHRPIIILIGSAEDYMPEKPESAFKKTSVQLLHERLENYDVRELTVSYDSNTWQDLLTMKPVPSVILMHASAFNNNKHADEAVGKFQSIVSSFHTSLPDTKLVVFTRLPRSNPPSDLCRRWKRQVDFLTSEKLEDRLTFYPFPRQESDFSGLAGVEVVQIVRCLSQMDTNPNCSTYLQDIVKETRRRIADTPCGRY